MSRRYKGGRTMCKVSHEYETAVTAIQCLIVATQIKLQEYLAANEERRLRDEWPAYGAEQFAELGSDFANAIAELRGGVDTTQEREHGSGSSTGTAADGSQTGGSTSELRSSDSVNGEPDATDECSKQT